METITRNELKLFTASWFFLGIFVGNGLWLYVLPFAFVLGFWGGSIEERFNSRNK